MKELMKEVSLSEFSNSGLLWYINQQLHLFGMCIAIEYEDDVPVRLYPARCRFRGFEEETNELGYARVSDYLLKNIEELAEEAEME